MKYLYSLFLISFASVVIGQSSEDYIPRDAVSVFSINNFTLLQKISMDDLVQYEFMEEVQQELFDGSTSGKTLKDAGIDFNQKLNIYYGKGKDYEVSGFSFGVSDKAKLFQVFDDFDRVESPYPGVEFYSSYFNHLIISGNVGILLRVDPNSDLVMELADSAWFAQGNTDPWHYHYDDYYEDYEDYEYEEYDEEYDGEFSEENAPLTPPIESYEEEQSEIYDEKSIDVIMDDEFDNNDLPVADANPSEKNYYEIKDSIIYILQGKFLDQICRELFVQNVNLKNSDASFARQLSHTSDGIFYLDNSRNFQKEQGLLYFQSMLPSLYSGIQELYTGNVMMGDLVINENSIDIDFEANYGEKLGSIYKELSDAKFDKKILNYIPENSSAYFSYNVNLREAYEQAFEVIMPILRSESDPRVAQSVLTIELLDEFLNKDAIFGTYKGSMFGSFNGVKSIEIERVIFSYDEETFEYSEEKVMTQEDIPVFTMGFSTGKPEVPEKIMTYLQKITTKITRNGDVWKIDKGFLDAIPLYLINTNGLFVITNDEAMVRNNAAGFGSEKISKKKFKKAKNGGVVYGFVDWSSAINTIPPQLFSESQQAVLQQLKQDAGTMELTSTKTSARKTEFQLSYNFDTESEDVGKYILDMINSLYVLGK